MNKCVDEITKKEITYSTNDSFSIFLRAGYNKKRIVKEFNSSQILDALKDFYALNIGNNQYKYLVRHIEGRKDSFDLVLRMKGSAMKAKSLKLKETGGPIQFQKVALMNLINCPITLWRKLSSENMTLYPASTQKWTKTKLMYCLMSYYFNLSAEEKYDLLIKSDELLLKEKRDSGESFDREKSRVEVIEVTDLL